MKARPKDLPKIYGWCRKNDHGVIFNPSEGCHVCRIESERKKKDLCCARLWHGPGHQSKTYCEIKGKHKIHQCTYGNYDSVAQWTGPAWKTKFTGYFDEPPSIEEKP